MVTIELVLLIIACGAFIAATFGVASKVNLVALGLACWVLTLLI